MATQVAVTVLFYYIIFILLLTCTPADEKGFRIAMIICFVPILLLCVWIIIGSTDYMLHAEYGYKKVFKADYKYKNFRRFAGYLAELHDTGVIAEEVITSEEKEKLLLVAKGKL